MTYLRNRITQLFNSVHGIKVKSSMSREQLVEPDVTIDKSFSHNPSIPNVHSVVSSFQNTSRNQLLCVEFMRFL